MGIFDGLTKGIAKGLAYYGQFLSSFVWSVEHATKDSKPLNELVVIAKQNLKELTDEAGNVIPSVIGSLIAGGDPFAGSRHSFQIWVTKHGKH